MIGGAEEPGGVGATSCIDLLYTMDRQLCTGIFLFFPFDLR